MLVKDFAVLWPDKDEILKNMVNDDSAKLVSDFKTKLNMKFKDARYRDLVVSDSKDQNRQVHFIFNTLDDMLKFIGDLGLTKAQDGIFYKVG
jgi:hypothetical protein